MSRAMARTCSAPAAFGLRHRRQRIRHVDEFEPVDLDGTRFELDGFTLAAADRKRAGRRS